MGVLDETQWVELKEAIPASSKPANLELAKDLASLSVDGGILIVGIQDANGAAGGVVGTQTVGLSDRIAQVATGRVSPPLNVTIDLFPHPDQAGLGVAVVTVPASEGAPHMVAGHYWGRGATGKRTLSDDEVRRLMADRQSRAAGFEQRLRHVREQLDPQDLGHPHRRGRMYVRLEPAGAVHGEPLSDRLTTHPPQQLMFDSLGFEPTYRPAFDSLNHKVLHPDGYGAASVPTGQTTGDDTDFLIVLIGDDGSLSMSCPAVRSSDASNGPSEVVHVGYLREVLHAAVVLAATVANRYAGYQGPWRTGVLVTDLRGRFASQIPGEFDSRRCPPYPLDEYLQVGAATTQEMSDEPAMVVTQLVRRLLRSLGVEGRYLPYTLPGGSSSRG